MAKLNENTNDLMYTYINSDNEIMKFYALEFCCTKRT